MEAIHRLGDEPSANAALATIAGDPASGAALIREWRATPSGPGVPVIARVGAATREVRDAWLNAGADEVAIASTPDDELVARFGRVVDDPSCIGGWPPRVQLAISQFNRGDTHDAHDGLEAEWRDEPRPVRYLWQGILQLGLAAWHEHHGNEHGTRHMLQTGLRHLRRFWPVAREVDVRALVAIRG